NHLAQARVQLRKCGSALYLRVSDAVDTSRLERNVTARLDQAVKQFGASAIDDANRDDFGVSIQAGRFRIYDDELAGQQLARPLRRSRLIDEVLVAGFLFF